MSNHVAHAELQCDEVNSAEATIGPTHRGGASDKAAPGVANDEDDARAVVLSLKPFCRACWGNAKATEEPLENPNKPKLIHGGSCPPLDAFVKQMYPASAQRTGSSTREKHQLETCSDPHHMQLTPNRPWVIAGYKEPTGRKRKGQKSTKGKWCEVRICENPQLPPPANGGAFTCCKTDMTGWACHSRQGCVQPHNTVEQAVWQALHRLHPPATGEHIETCATLEVTFGIVKCD